MDKELRILILEDILVDAKLIQFELEEAGIVFTAKVVMTEKDFIHELQSFSPDIILSDYHLPQYTGALALADAKMRCPDIPFILVSGAIGEDRAIEILTHGAKDYVFKNHLNRLAPAVRRALAEAEGQKARRKLEEELRKAHDNLQSEIQKRTAELKKEVADHRKTEAELRKSEAIYRIVADNTYSFEFWLNAQNECVYASPSCKRITGYMPEDFIRFGITQKNRPS